MRKIRHIPAGGGLVEITCRTFHSQFLLTPKYAWFDAAIKGAIGRAQREHGVAICGVVVMSNHMHILAWFDETKQMSDFMCAVNGWIAHEVTRATGWSGSIWEKRFTPILVSDEPEAQVARLRYLLSHGVKENLVQRVKDWPGLHCGPALAAGASIPGLWFDRTTQSRDAYARNRKAKAKNAKAGTSKTGNAKAGGPSKPRRICGQAKVHRDPAYAQPEKIVFSPLPCWRDLAPATIQETIAGMIAEVEWEASVARGGRGVLGAKRLLRQAFTESPATSKSTPAPAVHAFTWAVRKTMLDAYKEVVQAYRHAAERLKDGCRTVEFPNGCFPPGLPYVPHGSRATPVVAA